MAAIATSYDEVLYPGHPLPQTHPDRLATLATLFGMAPAPVERCRVLELGCGNGANLLPMALALPESRFVGIDLAARPLAQGQQFAEALGLKNLSLRQLDVLHVTPELGEFDYIIAHGFYSWVPPAVRDQLLAVCRANLAPAGVAYVSYNIFPGGHLRQMMRGMMLFHVRNLTEPQERITQARALVQFLNESRPASEAYRAVLAEEQKLVQDHSDGSLYHDDLGEINQPVYFYQFAEHVARHGLQYLAEADFFEMQDTIYPPAVREVLGKLQDNRIVREQYLDFLKCRRFRQTLLCRQEVPLERAPRPERLATFFVSSPCQPVSREPDIRSDAEEEFRGPRGAGMKTNHPFTKAVVQILGEEWPQPVALRELLSRARLRAGLPSKAADAEAHVRELGEILLGMYGAGLVRLHVYRPALARPGERPAVSALARLQARAGGPVTTLCHNAVRIDDPLGRLLIQLLDGTRDRAALMRDLSRALESGEVVLQHEGRPLTDPAAIHKLLTEQLEPSLDGLFRLGLLSA